MVVFLIALGESEELKLNQLITSIKFLFLSANAFHSN